MLSVSYNAHVFVCVSGLCMFVSIFVFNSQSLCCVVPWVFEMIGFIRDLQKRALRDDKDKIRICITSTDGKKYQFVLPAPEDENARLELQVRPFRIWVL